MKTLHKFCMSLLFLLSFAQFAMEQNNEKTDEWSTATFSSTKNSQTGEKTYVVSYPVDIPQGLVKVKTALYGAYINPETNITVDRHTTQQIIISAVLAQKIVATKDESENDNPNKEYKWIWLPWWTDSITNAEDLFKAVTKTKLRGNNRLTIEIREPGNYHIMIPDDADAEIKTKVGNIDYKSKIPTSLHIASKTVNKAGSSGSSTENGQSWSYYWADSYSPKSTQTRLIAKSGHINVP